jgi:uncharacterized SAM-binding protein YcdF (DUF218 family)
LRLVAVLGYSSRRVSGLHPICAARVRHGEEIAVDGDTVLLSGWGRRGGTAEGELMRDAWGRADSTVVVDATARNTRDNAAAVADAAKRFGADEFVLVTSGWHAFRARALVRAALPGAHVETSSPGGPRPLTLVAREVACLAVLPLHLRQARRRRA